MSRFCVRRITCIGRASDIIQHRHHPPIVAMRDRTKCEARATRACEPHQRSLTPMRRAGRRRSSATDGSDASMQDAIAFCPTLPPKWCDTATIFAQASWFCMV
jgi:hypothetical protein